MSKSYRIRTKVGVDKSIKVQLEQDFEQLEILSLKILQSQVYSRLCSDYGVLVGRVTANNGYGLPNCKVSIFIPLDAEDELNPNIASIYPYKTLNDINELGYRYNLLPSTKQHGGHTPTGTFPTRQQVLTDQTTIEIFDKYFKLTTKTNNSGDYMLFGAPIGAQQIHIDIDLSDIGEFSLSPQDLVRLNIADTTEVNGVQFKSSTNLGSLPQILSLNRNVEVEPLWGQPEICNLGITRTDFDITEEFGVTIVPAAIFVGSIFSNVDERVVKKTCNINRKLGNLCNLTTGPGEILAIRQTINIDSNGRPVLERFELEEGGKCIDENGTWLIDVPMNLDYVYTDEFGQRAISYDPKVGIPSRAKYRFKVKWQQAPTVSAPIKRADFLVPNIKEWGWQNTGTDPSYNDDTSYKKCTQPDVNLLTSDSYKQVNASYAFSLDWDDYGAGPFSQKQQMIQEAIDCVDRFYDMKYNKVYTVSQLITEYKGRSGNKDYIAIRDILNEECEGTTNKFPANDGQYQADILVILFNLIMFIFTPVIWTILILTHVVALIVCILAGILLVLKSFICGIRDAFCWLAELDITILGVTIRPLGFLRPFCQLFDLLCSPLQDAYNSVNERCKKQSLKLPLLSYPDCEMCPCEVTEPQDFDSNALPGVGGLNEAAIQGGASAILTSFLNPGFYECGGDDSIRFGQLQAGEYLDPDAATDTDRYKVRAPQIIAINDQDVAGENYWFTSSLPPAEKMNLFNVKAKYFDNNIGTDGNYGGGWNRIKATFNIDTNDYNSKWHLDNVLVLMVSDADDSDFAEGRMLSFIDNNKTQDPNLNFLTTNNQFGTKSLTGTTIGTPVLDASGNTIHYIRTINIPYANPNGMGNLVGANNTGIVITASTADTSYSRFSIDNEYFQVIRKTTVSDYLSIADASDKTSLAGRILNGGMKAFGLARCSGFVTPPFGPLWDNLRLLSKIETITPSVLLTSCLENFGNQKLVFLLRGVDPNSSRTKCRFDLSRLYGQPTNFNTGWGGPQYIVEADFKLNIPIQGTFKNIKHNIGNNNTVDSYSQIRLFYEPYSYQLDVTLFQTFTTSATTLYSNFDSTSTLGYNGTFFDPSNEGARVTNANFFTKELHFNIANYINSVGDPNGASSCNYYLSNSYSNVSPVPIIFAYAPSSNPNDYANTPSNSRNRGYFQSEVVEGAGFMGMAQPNFDLTGSQYAGSPAFVGLPPSSSAYYYTRRYNEVTDALNITTSQYTVMRSDRLPTSSTFQDNGTVVSYTMHQNSSFSIFFVSDNGSVEAVTSNVSNVISGGNSQDNLDDLNQVAAFTGVSNTFECGGIVPLRCYDVASDGTVTVLPEGDNCYTNGINNEEIVNGGCYTLVTVPIVSLPLDFLLVMEWTFRMKLNFAACRNVFGHIFTNSWINGTLFMFPFANETLFTNPGDTPPNTPFACICKHLVFYDISTQNFYYRSAPYKYLGGFTGRDNPKGTLGQDFKGNTKDLMFPTTLMDLGPRNDYMTELTFSGEYEGYIMNRMNTTSFQDVSDLINLWLVSRTVSTTLIGAALQATVGVFIDPMLFFFSRPNNKIDGDYAQMVATNSQIGVVLFDPADYGAVGEIFFTPANAQKMVFGIFYKSDMQIRDWLTPHRRIIADNVPATSNCAFDNSPIFSQEVPFYHWNIKPNESADDSIFGEQKNDWDTNPSTFWYWNYQGIDRTSYSLSTNFQPGNTTQTMYSKGYIYGVDGAGGLDAYLGVGIPPGNPTREFLNGSPFYFFFGLNKGRSAYDRFLKKWVVTETNVI